MGEAGLARGWGEAEWDGEEWGVAGRGERLLGHGAGKSTRAEGKARALGRIRVPTQDSPGSVPILSDPMSAPQNPTTAHRPRAIVLGGGVSGSTCALELARAGWAPEIWAEAFGARTTSGVAAALWYPYMVEPRERAAAWSAMSYSVFQGLAEDASTGVRMVEGTELFPKEHHAAWWREGIARFRDAREEELPEGYRSGHVFEAPIVEMPVYLAWLDRELDNAGVPRVSRRVETLGEAAEEAPLVVNTTGLGAGELVGDGRVYPARGQIVRVRAPGVPGFVLDDYGDTGVTYIVPRGDDVVLGGTFEPDCTDPEPDPSSEARILDRCAKLVPALVGAEIVSRAVGLRPCRDVVRVEREEIDGTIVVHDYGHGGAGVTLSWGCAREVVELAGPPALAAHGSEREHGPRTEVRRP